MNLLNFGFKPNFLLIGTGSVLLKISRHFKQFQTCLNRLINTLTNAVLLLTLKNCYFTGNDSRHVFCLLN